MNIFEQTLGEISGGRVLDVATGNGSFIKILVESLKDYTEILGVDISQHAGSAVRKSSDQKNISFVQMDATHLDFDDASFDTVCISNSLHHLPNLPQVLAEMKRVLRPDGHYVISEMYRDDQKEPQLTHVHLHHWWAEIDTALGFTHNETYTRQQIVDMAEGLKFGELFFVEYADLNTLPHDEKNIKEVDEVIDQYLQRAKDLPNYACLEQQSHDLRRRVYEVGIQDATCLVAIGKKN